MNLTKPLLMSAGVVLGVTLLLMVESLLSRNVPVFSSLHIGVRILTVVSILDCSFYFVNRLLKRFTKNATH